MHVAPAARNVRNERRKGHYTWISQHNAAAGSVAALSGSSREEQADDGIINRLQKNENRGSSPPHLPAAAGSNDD